MHPKSKQVKLQQNDTNQSTHPKTWLQELTLFNLDHQPPPPKSFIPLSANDNTPGIPFRTCNWGNVKRLKTGTMGTCRTAGHCKTVLIHTIVSQTLDSPAALAFLSYVRPGKEAPRE